MPPFVFSGTLYRFGRRFAIDKTAPLSRFWTFAPKCPKGRSARPHPGPFLDFSAYSAVPQYGHTGVRTLSTVSCAPQPGQVTLCIQWLSGIAMLPVSRS